ncbi:hypothetical protein [Brevibacillus brevis]|uniref:hypothetical protein n=1 Tax=Brevibacillus brevis TaxID=1393 RepID=UPI001156F874|nr:hypothetical protein [Lysinibacillus sp. SDF0063]TQR38698.1 hypothetical protein C7Y45_01120 [Lysinibacillus sp. SDF0063]
MKKWLVTLILLSAAIVFSACNSQKPNSHTSELSQQVTPVNKTEGFINTVNQASDTKTTDLSTEELKQYLNAKKSDIPTITEKDNETGTISVMESHMVFPFVFVKSLGISFIFPNDTDDINPTYLNVNKATNIRNINVKGAMPGMNFKDIISKLENAQVKKTWISTEDNVAYKIDYKLDDVVYTFISSDELGNESQLFISLDDNY